MRFALAEYTPAFPPELLDLTWQPHVGMRLS
jgi:hypothetical protein